MAFNELTERVVVDDPNVFQFSLLEGNVEPSGNRRPAPGFDL